MTTTEVNVDEMREAIVGGNTYNGYKYSILQIIEAANSNEHLEGWLTLATEESFKSMLEEVETTGAGARQKKARKNEWVVQALRNCCEQPILNVDNCTAVSFMRWLQSSRDGDGQFLSKSGYGNKCAALHHLFRCHPAVGGYPPGFERELKSLKKGFFRILATKQQDEGDTSENGGKKPMSYELYIKLCEWFLEEGTQTDIFAHCFLVMTWNLMCRSNNTTRILFEHITFEWDFIKVKFAQQKNDTQGYTQKYPRHIFANTFRPAVCPFLALAMYIATFGVNVQGSDRLFPGNSQYDCFTDHMMRTLKNHEDE